jgi:hypothetical protein
MYAARCRVPLGLALRQLFRSLKIELSKSVKIPLMSTNVLGHLLRSAEASFKWGVSYSP